MGYNRGDSIPIDLEPNGIPFGSKLNEKLSPRSCPIQFERKWNSGFLSLDHREVILQTASWVPNWERVWNPLDHHLNHHIVRFKGGISQSPEISQSLEHRETDFFSVRTTGRSYCKGRVSLGIMGAQLRAHLKPAESSLKPSYWAV